MITLQNEVPLGGIYCGIRDCNDLLEAPGQFKGF